MGDAYRRQRVMFVLAGEDPIKKSRAHLRAYGFRHMHFLVEPGGTTFGWGITKDETNPDKHSWVRYGTHPELLSTRIAHLSPPHGCFIWNLETDRVYRRKPPAWYRSPEARKGETQ